MPSPRGQFEDVRCDLDPRPRGAPMLSGDLSRLAGARPTARLRHRKPSESAIRRMHLHIIIAACHDSRLSSKIVADSLGLSDRHVRRIYEQKTKADAARKKKKPPP